MPLNLSEQDELITSQVVFSGISCFTLLAVLAVMVVFRKARDSTDRFLLALTIASVVFLATFTVPFYYHGHYLHKDFCTRLALALGTHTALVLIEGAFVGAVLYSVRRNRHVPVKLEVFILLMAIAACTGVSVFDARECRSAEAAEFQRQTQHYVLAIMAIIAADLLLCGALVISIRLRNSRFHEHAHQLTEHVAVGNSAFAKRQLQILYHTNREFQRFTRPLERYPLLFLFLMIPNILFVLGNAKPASADVLVAVMMISLRGLLFSIVYFLDPEARRQLHPVRWCNAAVAMFQRRAVRFSQTGVGQPEHQPGAGVRPGPSILKSRREHGRRLNFDRRNTADSWTSDDNQSVAASVFSVFALRDIPEDKVSLLHGESRL